MRATTWASRTSSPWRATTKIISASRKARCRSSPFDLIVASASSAIGRAAAKTATSTAPSASRARLAATSAPPSPRPTSAIERGREFGAWMRPGNPYAGRDATVAVIRALRAWRRCRSCRCPSREPTVEARVHAAGIPLEDLAPVGLGESQLVEVALGVVVMMPGLGIDALHGSQHLGGEEDVVGRDHLGEQL